MGMLREELRSIIEGPLGEYGVALDKVSERVARIRQNERQRVFGVSILRDGEDNFFIGEDLEPRTKKSAAVAVQGALQRQGRLLDDYGQPMDKALSAVALKALGDQEDTDREEEAKIGAAFKKLGKQYAQALSKMSGKSWKVSTAGDDILSLDSEDKQAVDIYWEFDPGSMVATVYVEGPKGKRHVYRKQKLHDIPKKNYVAWLQRTLSESMTEILGLVMMEAAEPERVFEHANIIEEVERILSEYGSKPPVKGRKTPEVVGSLTKVGALFRKLLVTLKRNGDHDNVVWLLRKEGVHDGDISYAIRHLKMPAAYAEVVECDSEGNEVLEHNEEFREDDDSDRIEW